MVAETDGRPMDQSLHLLLIAIFPALVVVGAVHDLASYTIPNWISVALALLFFPTALITGLDPMQIALNTGVGFGLLCIGVGMFAANWIGGGDAKLLAAAGLWIGWPAGIEYVLVTCLAGGALALMLTTARNTPLSVVALRGPSWMHKLVEKGGPAPYGVAIAFGGLFAFPSSTLVTALTAGL
jgi:prepilin peptidase CpaA